MFIQQSVKVIKNATNEKKRSIKTLQQFTFW